MTTWIGHKTREIELYAPFDKTSATLACRVYVSEYVQDSVHIGKLTQACTGLVLTNENKIRKEKQSKDDKITRIGKSCKTRWHSNF